MEFMVHNYANIHVELLNLLSPDVFTRVTMVKNALPDPPGELTAYLRPPSWTKGKEEGKRRYGTRERGGRGRDEDKRWKGDGVCLPP